MYKAFAALRTLFLIFIVAYTLVVAPEAIFAGTVTVTVDTLHRLQRATWLAIAWIAFETLLGWIVAAFRTGRTKPQGGPTQQPPAAPTSPA